MATSPIARTLCAVISVGAISFVGCSSTDESHDKGSSTSAKINTIPASARIVEEGRGSSDLSYTARDEGRIYVLDQNDNRVIYSASVDEGQRFVLSPSQDRATLDGREVLDRDLKAHRTYRIYFDEGDRIGTAARTDDRDAVLSRSSDRDDVVISRDKVPSDRDRTFSDIPRDATLVEQGTGLLEHRANTDGTIWVYDADSDRIVYSGHLHDGDRFRITDENRGTINGKVVFEREPMRENHRYRIYFERD